MASAASASRMAAARSPARDAASLRTRSATQSVELRIPRDSSSAITGESHGSDNFFKGENNGAPDATTTALSSFPSFLRNPGFATGRQVAVLPRGFVFAGPEDGGGDDHHLLQLAYNLESVAPFVRNQNYHKADKILKPAGRRRRGRRERRIRELEDVRHHEGQQPS